MGNYREMKDLLDAIEPEKLGGNPQDAYFRWYVLQLLYGIFSAVDSTSMSYYKMLKLQEAKAGAPAAKEPAPAPAPRAYPASRKGGQ